MKTIASQNNCQGFTNGVLIIYKEQVSAGGRHCQFLRNPIVTTERCRVRYSTYCRHLSPAASDALVRYLEPCIPERRNVAVRYVWCRTRQKLESVRLKSPEP